MWTFEEWLWEPLLYIGIAFSVSNFMTHCVLFSTHVSLWNVRVLAVSWVVLCVLFDLLLQTCSVRPLILIHPNPVPKEQERRCGWDVVGCSRRLGEKEKWFCELSFALQKTYLYLTACLKLCCVSRLVASWVSFFHQHLWWPVSTLHACLHMRISFCYFDLVCNRRLIFTVLNFHKAILPATFTVSGGNQAFWFHVKYMLAMSYWSKNFLSVFKLKLYQTVM